LVRSHRSSPSDEIEHHATPTSVEIVWNVHTPFAVVAVGLNISPRNCPAVVQFWFDVVPLKI
jgi:hypothetical protein